MQFPPDCFAELDNTDRKWHVSPWCSLVQSGVLCERAVILARASGSRGLLWLVHLEYIHTTTRFISTLALGSLGMSSHRE